MEQDDLFAVILAGGMGRRYGHPKAQLLFRGESLLQRAVSRVADITPQILVSVGQDQTIGDIEGFDVTVVRDATSDQGPLAALAGCLSRLKPNQIAIVVGCDMPFFSVELLLEQIDLVDGFDAVIPVAHERRQPLHGVYAGRCAETALELVAEGQLRLSALLDRLSVRYVDRSLWGGVTPQGTAFLNINAPDDFAKAERLAELGID